MGKAIYESDKLAVNSFKVLGLWDNGLKQLSSNTSMKQPSDLEGLSFRIQAATYNRKVAAQVNEEAKQAIEQAGTTIQTLTPAERQAFMDVVVPSVWKQYAGVIGPDLVDELLKNAQ